MHESVTIYVKLLDEGTEVWRPASARHLQGGTYELEEAAPSDERWEFPPGSRVVCREKVFSDGSRALVAAALA